MKIINYKKSTDGISFFLLFFSFFLIFFGIYLTSTYSQLDLFGLFFLLFVYIFPSLFFIDIFIWRNFGKEELIITENCILIYKKNRIFRKKKIIKINTIKQISIIDRNKLGLIQKSLEFWDFAYQGFIKIKYKRCRTFSFGENMYLEDIEDIINLVNSKKDK
jgi:hypothetical protein